MKTLCLSDFDGHLMDGFVFCRKVYALFDQIAEAPDGIRRLRLRDRVTKKLIEELLPLTHYVRARYSEGRLLKVRWIDGTQSYDAILLCRGAFVENGLAKASQYVEVTAVMHENEHLGRRLLEERGGSFGLDGISVDPRTKEIISQPVVTDDEAVSEDLLHRVLTVIRKKNAISYPADTALVIQCHATSIVHAHHWRSVVDGVHTADLEHQFFEIFLYEPVGRHIATLYPRRKD